MPRIPWRRRQDPLLYWSKKSRRMAFGAVVLAGLMSLLSGHMPSCGAPAPPPPPPMMTFVKVRVNLCKTDGGWAWPYVVATADSAGSQAHLSVSNDNGIYPISTFDNPVRGTTLSASVEPLKYLRGAGAVWLITWIDNNPIDICMLFTAGGEPAALSSQGGQALTADMFALAG